MKRFLISAAFALLIPAHLGCAAPRVERIGNTVTYIFGKGDLDPAGGQRVQDGIANTPGNFHTRGCIGQNTDPIALPYGGEIYVEVEADVEWEGMVHPEDPHKNNRAMFNIEAMSDQSLEYSLYRLSQMNTRVHAYLENGSYYVDAKSTGRPINSKLLRFCGKQTNLRVGVCEIRPNVSVKVKELRVSVNSFDEDVCGNSDQ